MKYRDILTLFCILALTSKQVWAQSKRFQLLETKKAIGVTPLNRVQPSWRNFAFNKYYFGYTPGRNFFITQPVIGAKLRYEFKDEIRKNGAVRTTDQYHKFAERIGLSSTGWIAHPNFCQFQVTFEPEWTQVYEKDPSENVSRSNHFSPDYLLTTTFFQKKDYSIRLHGSRIEAPSWSAFKGGSETISNTYGGEADLNYRFPQNLLHANLGYTRYDRSNDGYYDRDESGNDYFLKILQRHSKYNTTLDIDYHDSSRKTDNKYKTETKKFTFYVYNTYKFEDKKYAPLNTHLRFRTQEFNADSKVSHLITLTSYFSISHRKNLHSFYNINLMNSGTSGGNDNNSIGFNTRLGHLLYENLSTNAGIGVSYSDNTSGSQRASVRPSLSLQYRRDIPNGNIRLGTNWAYQYTDRKYAKTQQYIDVLNERHILSLGEETYLNNSQIDIDSIIVTNPAGDLQYIQGIDYTLESRGDYILIRRSPFSEIGESGAILAAYRYYNDPEHADGIFTQTYSGSLNLFRYWSFALAHSRYDQYIYHGQVPSSSVNGNSSTAQINYNTGWSNTDFTIGQYDRSSDLNYHRWKINQQFRFHPFKDFNINTNFFHGETIYNDKDNRQVYGISMSAGWNIIKNLRFSLNAYSNYIESGIENTNNNGLLSSLEYRYRIWTATLRYDLREVHNDNRDTSRIRHLIRFDIVRFKW